MGYFLNNDRRQSLISAMTKLSMPRHLADKFASFADDLAEIDRNMAAATRQASEYAAKLSELNPETDSEEGGILVMFIMAGVAILRTYKEEAQARNLPHNSFPAWRNATEDGLQLTNDVLAKFRAKISQNRTVH